MRTLRLGGGIAVLMICCSAILDNLSAMEFGYLNEDPRFIGTGNNTDTGYFSYAVQYPGANVAQRAHGENPQPTKNLSAIINSLYEVNYVPLPNPDTIKAHGNAYPATDSELNSILTFVNINHVGQWTGPFGFCVIFQMQGGKFFAAADNDLFKRLGLDAHQTDDSSDAVLSFPHPDHNVLTGEGFKDPWGSVNSFTWKNVGHLDKLDPKMECIATDQNGDCVFAAIEKGVLSDTAGGIYFLMNTNILSDYATNGTDEQNLWGNLTAYAIMDQYAHYVWKPVAAEDSLYKGMNGYTGLTYRSNGLSSETMNRISIVNNRLQFDGMGSGVKEITFTGLSGKRLFNAKVTGSTYTLPHLNYSGAVIVSVESNGEKFVSRYCAPIN